jgi:hypothetical protein
MQLNESEGTVAGRKIQLDTANGNQSGRRNQPRRNNGGDVDGSNFRGGKFSGRKDDGTAAQRTTLKLAPRTKRVEAGDGKAAGNDNIFGGARARDSQAWEDRRKPSDGDKRQSAQSGGGRGGRGGRGAKGEGGGKDRGRGSQDQRKPQPKQISPEERAAAAAAKAAAEAAAAAPAAKPKVPVNKFALLMDSDSE